MSQSKYWVAIKNGSQHCGKKITVYNTSSSKVIVLTVIDECPSCDSDNHLDMSLDALIELAGSVKSAHNVNSIEPKLIWSFGEWLSDEEQLLNIIFKSRKVQISTSVQLYLSVPTHVIDT